MNFATKAILFAEDSAFLNFLRGFLFKHGFRDTEITRDPAEIKKQVTNLVWPIIFIDHSEGYSDALAVFEGLYKQRGHELLTFVLVVPHEKNCFELYYRTMGPKGIIKKPLQPAVAEKLMREIIPKKDDAATYLALQTSKLVLQGEHEKAMPLLVKLASMPAFSRGALTSIIRHEIETGQYARAEDKLKRMLASNPQDIRALCEYCEIYKKRSQYSEALRCFKQIRDIHPEMTLKVWEQTMLHLELDEIDEAAGILFELQRSATYKEMATEALSRIMLFMGMAEYVAPFVKPYPALSKRFQQFLETTAIEASAQASIGKAEN